jgi:hypothetical protein
VCGEREEKNYVYVCKRIRSIGLYSVLLQSPRERQCMFSHSMSIYNLKKMGKKDGPRKESMGRKI